MGLVEYYIFQKMLNSSIPSACKSKFNFSNKKYISGSKLAQNKWHIWMLSNNMIFNGTILYTSVWTVGTGEGFLPSMCSEVLDEVALVMEQSATERTGDLSFWPSSRQQPHSICILQHRINHLTEGFNNTYTTHTVTYNIENHTTL